MKRNLDEIKHYSRRNNLEVKGIPHSPDECLGTLITEIASKRGVQIADSDIDVIHQEKQDET